MLHTSYRRAGRGRRLTALLAVGCVALIVLSGCALFAGPKAHPTPSHTRSATPKPTPTATAGGSRVGTGATASPAPVVAPILTPVPAGTLVAEGDVASPKGSIHFHYRVVANGDNTYSA